MEDSTKVENEFESSFKSLEVGDRLRLKEGCCVTTEVGRKIRLSYGEVLKVVDDSPKFCYDPDHETNDNIYIGIRVSQGKDEALDSALFSFVVPMYKCEIIKKRV
jgi:hypothetical protein